jgi:hypothetical protein
MDGEYPEELHLGGRKGMGSLFSENEGPDELIAASERKCGKRCGLPRFADGSKEGILLGIQLNHFSEMARDLGRGEQGFKLTGCRILREVGAAFDSCDLIGYVEQ